MNVVIKPGSELRQFLGGKEAIEVKGSTVYACLSDLIARYPKLKERLFDANGTLLITVILNQRLIFQKDLNTGVSDGDEIRLVMIASGGKIPY